ncbi:photosynthetic reaction center cytochrome c subunit [Candidatus Chloroploca sp. M-50]|uniref:Photosynthetic reaction center cytochrome c subunit n=1 Tax=Candidatus Chloroploca mongolica TaxID=2528176 RepID=A0ABS4D5D5_9CHLR|nr:cytochrome c-554 Puf2C [Candidatus Chloroploca mongolica]MBP1464644.1 photosynthetic reaction center cytochrome c subunit [Candidatus Chloroploca mongolica]
MQSPTRPTDRQAAIFISVAVGIIVAVVTTATFWWIYSLTLGPERAAAALNANAPWSPSEGIKAITDVAPNIPPEGREPWLGNQAWTEGVQAGQAWVDANPNTVNVQVLSGMTSAQIWTYMQQYVSGGLGVGCQYCHNLQNFASDEYAEKISARNMLYLVSDVNTEFIVDLPNWRGNYVQCATCHYNEPNNLEAVGTQFIKSVPDIPVVVDPLDENGMPILDPALKPEEIRGQVGLQDAVLFYIYNYQIWRPFDPADDESGRGSLALTLDGGRTQDQVTINQNVMNYNSWALGQGCTYCHNSRNFIAYELGAASNITNPEAGYNKLKAARMMQLTTWLAFNWTINGALPYDAVPTALEGGASRFSYRNIDGEIFNVPGCYTCHRGVNIPTGSINQAQIPAGDAGVVVLPPVLRGN